MLTGIEQTLSIEKGSRTHDDAPDADEGANLHFTKIYKSTRVST